MLQAQPKIPLAPAAAHRAVGFPSVTEKENAVLWDLWVSRGLVASANNVAGSGIPGKTQTLKSWETGMQSRARENETKSSLPKTFTVKETPPTVWRIHGNIIIFVPKT